MDIMLAAKAEELFELLRDAGSDYASAMHEARIWLTEARLDAGLIRCPDALPAWTLSPRYAS